MCARFFVIGTRAVREKNRDLYSLYIKEEKKQQHKIHYEFHYYLVALLAAVERHIYSFDRSECSFKQEFRFGQIHCRRYIS